MVVPVPIRPVRASAWDEPLPRNPPIDIKPLKKPAKQSGPRRALDWQDGLGWVVSDSIWSTPDKVLAEAIRAELDRVDPLPSFFDEWFDPLLIEKRRWWEL